MCRYNLSALSMCRGPQFWPLSTTLQPDRTRSYFLLQLQSAGLLAQRSVSPQTQWTSPNMDWQLRQTNNDWNTHNSYSNTHIGHKGDPVKIKHDKNIYLVICEYQRSMNLKNWQLKSFRCFQSMKGVNWCSYFIWRAVGSIRVWLHYWGPPKESYCCSSHYTPQSDKLFTNTRKHF